MTNGSKRIIKVELIKRIRNPSKLWSNHSPNFDDIPLNRATSPSVESSIKFNANSKYGMKTQKVPNVKKKVVIAIIRIKTEILIRKNLL